MSDLMAEHSSHAILALADVEDTTEDEDFTAGNDKSVHLIILDDVNLPIILIGWNPTVWNQPVEDFLNKTMFRIRGWKNLASILLHRLLIQLFATLFLVRGGDDVETTAM